MTITPINVTCKKNINLDTLKDAIFNTIDGYLCDDYGIDNPQNEIENYDTFIIIALTHSIKHFYSDDTVVTIE